MSKWDVDYINLCKRILDEGVEVENRTGINTIKIPSHHFVFYRTLKLLQICILQVI